MKRVVVTGLGALTPLGNDTTSFWSNITNGVSGAGPITRYDAQHFKTRFACELKGFDPTAHLDRNDLKRYDPFTQYAVVAAAQAVADAGFDLEKMNPYDVGVIWGTGQGGMDTFEQQVKEYALGGMHPRFSPFFVPRMIANMASGVISIRHGFMGINYTTVSACATGNTAIMDAFNYIRLGKAKIIITGGSESPISEASIGGFNALKALSTNNDNPQGASRPFAIDRDGFVMGEGAGALVLEDLDHALARGAHIYAEVGGAAMTADAYHLTATHPEGKGAQEGMRQALAEAGLTIHDVDYVNAHATSTPLGDLSEAHAINNLAGGQPGKNLHISATKSMTGHLLGAAGAIEAIISIMAIRDGIVPPTINTEELDPGIPTGLQIVTGTALEKPINAVLSNTFGFGGHNAILVLKRFS